MAENNNLEVVEMEDVEAVEVKDEHPEQAEDTHSSAYSTDEQQDAETTPRSATSSSNSGSRRRYSAPRIAAYACGCLVCCFILFLIIAAIVAHAVVENNEDKYLQPPSSLREDIQNTIATEFDPLEIDETSSEDLDDMSLGFGCVAKSLTYTIGTLTGLKSMDITQLDLLEDTGNLQMEPLGFNGFTWDGTFFLNSTIDTLTADIRVVVETEGCPFGLAPPPVTGSATITSSALEMIMDMEGKTDNIFDLLASKSTVHRADIQDLKFEFESLSVGNLKIFGFDLPPQLDFVSLFADSFQQEVTEQIQPLMLETIQESLNDELPFTP